MMNTRTPRLFSRGAPLWVRQSLYVLLALLAIVIDDHYHQLNSFRNLLYITLQPLQIVANLPTLAIQKTAELFSSKNTLQEENNELKSKVLKLTIASQNTENQLKRLTELEALSSLQQSHKTELQITQILYSVHNPLTQKLVIDGGAQQKALLGSPVIASDGLMGQITKTYPKSSELTLLSDVNLSVPVENSRTGYRTITKGNGDDDLFTLVYVPITSDFKVGDELVTSGMGGTYPAGLHVGHIISVTHENNSAYYRILCQASHGLRMGQYVAVLKPTKDPELTEKIIPLEMAPPQKEKKKVSEKRKK